MRTGSAFEALVNAIQHPNLVGKDSPLFPLTHAGLKLLIDNEARMVQFLQRKFRFRDSQAKLSDDDARDLALAVAGRLRSGALLLQPHTLARACAMMSVSPPHQRMVYLGPRSHVPIADIHQHGALSATKQVRRGPSGCCAWLAPLHSLTPPVWFHCPYHATAGANVM